MFFTKKSPPDHFVMITKFDKGESVIRIYVPVITRIVWEDKSVQIDGVSYNFESSEMAEEAYRKLFSCWKNYHNYYGKTDI